MKDEGLTTEPGLTRAEAAVSYLLQRMRVDADLRWHLVGTEAFARLCEAEAVRTGQALEDVKRHYAAAPLNGDRPRLVEAREAIRKAVQTCCNHLLNASPWGKNMLDELERHAG